jgi:hypothetical protein
MKILCLVELNSLGMIMADWHEGDPGWAFAPPI